MTTAAEMRSYDLAAKLTEANYTIIRLRADLTAMQQRAKAAEAKLAAVPVEALQSIVNIAVIAGTGDGPLQADMAAAIYWLDQQGEVKP